MKTLKYAVRFLMRARSYTLINLLGLALSLACCIVLTRYIHRELTVDTHCIDRTRSYAVVLESNGTSTFNNLYKKAPELKDKLPIEQTARFMAKGEDFVVCGENRFTPLTLFADSSFFQMFRYPIVQGTATLAQPGTALLTESFARKVFGREDPVGKVLRYSDGTDVLVEGIVGEPANKTSLKFDLVLSPDMIRSFQTAAIEIHRFLPGTDIEAMQRLGQTERYLMPGFEKELPLTFTFRFMPVEEMYWDETIAYSNSIGLISKEMFQHGKRSHVNILIGVCILLLLTGVLNFVNIYLITLMRRGKEYGLKKVYGASGRNLFMQIGLENLLLVGAALLVAWLFIEISAGFVHRLFNYSFGYSLFDLQLSVGLLVFLPLLTSVYPFVKYNYSAPLTSIRSIGQSRHSVRSRMVFLAVQYVLTFLLIIFSLFFNKQLRLMLDTPPGFRTNDILVAQLYYQPMWSAGYGEDIMQFIDEQKQKKDALHAAINACPLIKKWAVSNETILAPATESDYSNNKGERIMLETLVQPVEFYDLYGIRCVDGRLPIKNDLMSRDVVVNRAAMKVLGYTSLEGATIREEAFKNDGDMLMQITGVVEDYYNGHLTLGTRPKVFAVAQLGGVYQMAYPSGKLQELLEYLRKTERDIFGYEDFDYHLLEDELHDIYKGDRQTAAIYSIFAAIAIFVSALGLFGISLFDIRQRYREIAIRKVNGAGLKDLYLLLFRKYAWTLVGAFAMAVPLSYCFIYFYTQDFAVKASLDVGIYLFSLLVIIAISLGTLWWQIRKAASINPAKIMKVE